MTSRKISSGMLGAVAAMVAVGVSPTVQAGEISFTETFTNGTQAATAVFTFNDDGATTTLSIQLINDMTVTASGTNPQWLQGVFFDITGTPTMTYTGLGGDGSDAYNDLVDIVDGGSGPDTVNAWSMLGTDGITPVLADHFWAMRQNIGGGELPFGTQSYGVAAAGLGVFGPTTVLNFVEGGPEPQVGGPDGGILSGTMIDDGTLDIPDGIATNNDPMIDGGIWLTFDLGDYDINDAYVSEVFFQFGTSFGEVIPVPMALPMAALGLAGIVCGRRRLRKIVEA